MVRRDANTPVHTHDQLGSGDSACAASEALGELTRATDGALESRQLTPAFHAHLKRLPLVARLTT